MGVALLLHGEKTVGNNLQARCIVNEISFNDYLPDPHKFPKLPPPLPPIKKPNEVPKARTSAPSEEYLDQ